MPVKRMWRIGAVPVAVAAAFLVGFHVGHAQTAKAAPLDGPAQSSSIYGLQVEIPPPVTR